MPIILCSNYSDLYANCSSHLNEESEGFLEINLDNEVIQKLVNILVPLFFSIIGIFGFVGNSIVLIVMLTEKTIRSNTNILIVNLAIADLLFVTLCIPFTAADFVLPTWPFGNVWCKVVQYLIIVTAFMSIYILVLMSFDRFLAVVHPVSSLTLRTRNHTVMVICILWTVILLLCTPILVTHGEIRGIRNQSSCRTLPQYKWSHFQIPFFIISFVLPLILICVFYLCILCKLWSRVRVRNENRRGRKRITRLIFILVLVFAVCWLPIQVILVIKSVDMYPLTTETVVLQIISHILAYTNSCINPILYAFLSEQFRKSFQKIFNCLPRREPDNQLRPMRAVTATT